MNRLKTWKKLIILWPLALSVCTALPQGTAAQDSPPSSTAPERRALLIGINDYSASGLTAPTTDGEQLTPEIDRRSWPSLRGALNDVEGMHAALTGAYGFQPDDVHLLTDQAATRSSILQAIEEHLIKPAREGDLVVFHYSGHGSQVSNPDSKERDKLNETIVPADSRLGVPDIEDKELRQAFNRVLDKKAHLVVILDSCYSGSAARGEEGLPDGGLARALTPSSRRAFFARADGPEVESRGALVLSASQDNEPAREALDEAGRPYGALTLALLRALRQATVEESAEHTFERTLSWLSATGRYQRPALEGLPKRRAAPLFGPRSDHRAGVVVVSAEPDSEGMARLLGGRVNGLAVGSELRLFGAKDDDDLRLLVKTLDGLNSSIAEILPAGRKIGHGDLFELRTWSAPDVGPLQVWIPATTEPEEGERLARELQALAANGEFLWVDDPTEKSPSHVLRWRDEGFELLGPQGVVSLGRKPGAAMVQEHLKPKNGLFVQLPVPVDLLQEVELGTETRHSAVQPIDDPQATYYLVGRWHGGASEYAWIRPQALRETSAQPQALEKDPHRGLPARSAWHELPANAQLDELATKLEDKALRLAKTHAWLYLQSPATKTYPYRLALMGDDGPVTDGRLHEGLSYRFALETVDGKPAPIGVRDRFVYAFSIDSAGNSVLLYPQSFLNTENIFPGPSRNADRSAPARIDLGIDSSFDVVAPFGEDIFFLVTSATPISDPGIFAYPGVRGESPGGSTALAKLLARIGSTRRGTAGRAPKATLRWSVERKLFKAVATEDSK